MKLNFIPSESDSLHELAGLKIEPLEARKLCLEAYEKTEKVDDAINYLAHHVETVEQLSVLIYQFGRLTQFADLQRQHCIKCN